ncbi:hypothetical protein Tco_1529914, partial [Tanacetum coccineum]
MRAEAQSTSHSLPLPPLIILSYTRSDAPSSGTPPLLPIPAPTSFPSLLLPSTNRREDIPKVTLPPRKRLGIALGPRYEVEESSSTAAARPTGGSRAEYGFVATLDREIRRDPERYVGYEITDTWDEMLEDMPVEPSSDDTELGRRMTEFATRVRQDTDEIYMRLDDEQTKRQLMAGQLNMLYRDRRAHARTGLLMEKDRLGCLERPGDDPWTLKMTPKRAIRSNTALETTNTTFVTNAQLQGMIDQGVTADLAARDADRNTNGDDSHNSGTGVRSVTPPKPGSSGP